MGDISEPLLAPRVARSPADGLTAIHPLDMLQKASLATMRGRSFIQSHPVTRQAEVFT